MNVLSKIKMQELFKEVFRKSESAFLHPATFTFNAVDLGYVRNEIIVSDGCALQSVRKLNSAQFGAVMRRKRLITENFLSIIKVK